MAQIKELAYFYLSYFKFFEKKHLNNLHYSIVHASFAHHGAGAKSKNIPHPRTRF